MKTLFFILLNIIWVSLGFSQNQPKLDNYPFESLEVNVVVFPFGLDNPIKIGTVSKSGNIDFEFPKELAKNSNETEENFMRDVSYAIFNVCDNGREMIADNENGPSFEAGILSMATNDKPYAGVIYGVSDDELMP